MSDSRSPVMKLFSTIWGVFVFLFRAVIVISFLVSAALMWFIFKGGQPAGVEDNVALVLAPSGVLVEQFDEDPSRKLLEGFAGEAPAQSRLRDLIDALRHARSDARIPFAVLRMDGLAGAGLPQLQELVAEIQAFRAAGKKVIAYGPWYDQSHYLVAAAADEVVLDPMGMVAIEGFSSYNNYFKEALDKLGVDLHVFRVGEYKSAVEPFTRNDMSAEARAASLEWLGDLWRDYGATIAASRQLPATAADDYVKGLGAGLAKVNGDAAAYAKESGLVTQIEGLTAFRKRMAEITGFDDEHGSFRQIHYLQYLAATQRERAAKLPAAGANKVALVVVQGEIVDGAGAVGQAGGDTIADLLDEARRDQDVVAVVLRIDSPGGSVWGSEQIRRAVQNLKADGKPVVASMATVAASGGYWVAMDADQIWAHSSTITGSIGIFGMLPTLDRSLAKLGIHTDGVGTTPLSGSFRLDRPLRPEVGTIIQSQIDKGYRDFIQGVADGRKLPLEKVDEIARGRVWSGGDAKDMGLIDHLGGLEQAANAAAELGGLSVDSYRLDERFPPLDFASQLLASLSGSVRIDLLPGVTPWLRTLTEQADLERVLSSFNDPRGMYAHCFCRPAPAAAR
jgi:protease-4